jgi:hypothetical protein
MRKAGGDMLFNFVDLKSSQNLKFGLSILMGHDIPEKFLLQTQTNFVHMWFDLVRVGAPPFDSLSKLRVLLTDELFQPGIMRTNFRLKFLFEERLSYMSLA